MKNTIINIPNLISIARVASSPLIAIFYVTGYQYTVFTILILMSLSDALDGYIARKYNMGTSLGGMLDPIADKCIFYCLLVSIIATNFYSFNGDFEVFIITMLSLFIIRDFSVDAIRMYAIRIGSKNINSIPLAKVKTAIQFFGLVCILFAPEMLTSWGPLVISLVLSYITLCMYCYFLFWSTD